MIRPLLTENQRFEMRINTYYAAGIKLHLSFLYFRRELQRAIDNDLKNIKTWIDTLK